MQTDVTNTDPITKLHDGQLRRGPATQRMIVVAIVLAAAGFGSACILGLGRTSELRSLFFHAYLVAFAFYLSITLGALFFVMLHHLARSGWSVTLRRLAEALSGNIGLMGVLFVPLLFGMGDLYAWSHPTAATHGLSASRAAYLSPGWFIARFVVYFAVWGGLTWYLRTRSVRQDVTGDVRLSRAMERVSAAGVIVLGLTVTTAAIDLLMSLNPYWSSTIFGVYYFTDCMLGGLVVITLLAMRLQKHGYLRQAVTTEHYHDLGKLTFSFVIFWGYIAFSQYLLIWYANMPEETQFYLPRQIGPWAGVSIVLVVFHLLIPLAGLLSRLAKRRVMVLAFWALWLLVAQLLDLFWLVMPNVFIRQIPAAVGMPPGSPLPEALKRLIGSNQAVYQVSAEHAAFVQAVLAPLEPTSLAILIGLVVGMGGVYLASTLLLLRSAALVPLRDPRLAESLAFENT